MKGFVISVDAVIALIIVFAMLAAITVNFSSQKISFSSLKTEIAGEDVLAVLEKSGMLEQAAESNSNNEIAKYLGRTAESQCFELNIIDEGNTSTVTKKGCKKTNEMSSVKRIFFSEANEKFYLAELISWNKAEK